jgi:RNA polymerase sigma-70 factor (ECF subfamily)
LIDQYRKTKWERTKRDDFNDYYLASTFESPENGVVRSEHKKIIWESLNHLSSDIRMVLILRDFQEKKYEEIAEIMGLPLGTIKSRVNRGRLQLAKILKEKKEKENEM